ncbi:MAG: formimidoylglutamate deiminase, partial [Rhizobiaceae bacterium]
RESGAISVGRFADLVALDRDAVDLHGLAGDTLLDAYVFAGDDRMVSDVWSAGRHVVTGGRHRRRDEIDAAYRATLAELRDAL